MEEKWCFGGTHSDIRTNFLYPDGQEADDACLRHRATSSSFVPSTPSTQSLPQSSQVPTRNLGRAARDSRVQLQRLLHHAEPPLAPVDDMSGHPALNATDEALLNAFNRHLDNDVMEHCYRCGEKWFSMNLDDWLCTRCQNRDKGIDDAEPYLMSSLNKMDPGEVPGHLPKLTIIEEILIARVHVSMQIFMVRG